jgi:hypothetical protein
LIQSNDLNTPCDFHPFRDPTPIDASYGRNFKTVTDFSRKPLPAVPNWRQPEQVQRP